MKKKYMTPTASATEFRVEGMVAQSIGVGDPDGPKASASGSYTRRQGWSSELWSDMDATEE